MFFLIIQILTHGRSIVPRRIVTVTVVIGRQSELAGFQRQIAAPEDTPIGDGVQTYRSRITLQGVFHHDDIDNPPNSLGIILHTRLRDNLDVLHRACRHAFQYYRRIIA